MVSFISAVIVLIVLLALGSFLEPLPRACLGSIIVVALINLLKQALDLKYLWRVSLIDAVGFSSFGFILVPFEVVVFVYSLSSS